ncbi:MAG TPA: glycosyltransferase family 4 protein, partial [Chitinophagaceae bacterium]|nr:glycosyltransferase family 4 protein [Chitinophagaceae bacterium]
MNILIVSQMRTDSPTGVSTYYLSLRDEYVKMGHFVHIITPQQTPIFLRALLRVFRWVVSIINTDFNKLYVSEFGYFVSTYYAVRKVRKMKNWDIIHGQDPSSSCAARLSLKKKVPVVATCHFNDNPVEERKLAYQLSPRQIKRVTKWFKYLFSKIDNFIFVSEYQYHQSTHLLKPGINWRVIQNGVPFHEKKNIESDPACFTIINVGTLEDRKNQIFLIKAASCLAKKGLSFKIFLLGDGPLRAAWQKEVLKEGLGDRIIFKGHIKEVIDTMQVSQLYVHVSKNESSSSVCILEAFSIGLPVVAIANGAISEYFPKSGSGLRNRRCAASRSPLGNW